VARDPALPGAGGGPRRGRQFFACILMYIYIRIAAVQVQSLSLRHQLQGAWPLVHQFLRRWELPQLLAA
jgi:hypothetical protein